jgi:phosphate transport system substrate-binding protein
MIRLVRAAGLWLVAALVFVQAGASFGADAVIHGAGATFPFPLYAKWAADYQRETGVDVRYDPVGSGAGVQQIERKLVDFGASDVPLARAELQRLGLVQFPAVIGGVVPVVNLSGIKSADLKLSGQVLGDIYLGKIRKWNDRAIVALNPGLSLPSSNITVVHRSDSSGTTFLWSAFLSRSSPEWQATVGTANLLAWPVGVAEAGNEGVASAVQRTRVSIGYVEYAYAAQHKLSVVSVRNREGHFVAPGAVAFESAASSARWEVVADLDQSLIDQAGPASWPITAATYVLLRARPEDADRTREVIKFFDWALRRARKTASDLDYVPIPDSAIDLIGRVWSEQVRLRDGGAVWPAARPLH